MRCLEASPCAMREIGKPELLLPIGMPAGTRASSAANNSRLSSKSSATVSITQVTPAQSFQPSMLPASCRAADDAAVGFMLCAICTARASARPAFSALRPRKTTAAPASIKPAPMPSAIVPVPITTILSMLRVPLEFGYLCVQDKSRSPGLAMPVEKFYTYFIEIPADYCWHCNSSLCVQVNITLAVSTRQESLCSIHSRN